MYVASHSQGPVVNETEPLGAAKMARWVKVPAAKP